MVIQCDSLVPQNVDTSPIKPLRTEPNILTNKARKCSQELSIQCNPNRDVLVIKIGENVFSDLKELRKVEVHLGTRELVRLPPKRQPILSDNGDKPPLRDALMCNIYKAISKAKMEQIAKNGDFKRKIASENCNEYRDSKRLKAETAVPKVRPNRDKVRPKVRQQCEDHFKAKPIPFIVFVLCTIGLGIVYCQSNKPLQNVGLEEVGIKDADPISQDVVMDSHSWKPVRIAQDILRVLPADSRFLHDSHVFWRTNLDDPRVRFLLRWISNTMWRRRRRERDRRGEGGSRTEIAGPTGDDTGVDAILDNLAEDPSQQALAVVDQNRWTHFRRPSQVTNFAWNILLDFVYYWLTY